MVHALDGSVQRLVGLMRRKQMWKDTLLVFASDNGGPIYRNGSVGGSNFPLRGGKESNFEGGVRVNAFLSGGAIQPSMRGTRLDGLVALWDWYATLAPKASAAWVTSPTRGLLPPTPAAPRLDQPLAVLVSGQQPRSPVNGLLVDERHAGPWKLQLISHGSRATSPATSCEL